MALTRYLHKDQSQPKLLESSIKQEKTLPNESVNMNHGFIKRVVIGHLSN